MAKVKPIPEGYHSVTPYLIMDGAADAIDFYTKVFGATERIRMGMPGGKIGHAEVQIGDSVVMLADEMVEMGYRGAKTLGGSPVTIHLYVDDCDQVVAAAVAAGATLREEVADRFYGDRSGQIVDPWGHVWNVGTHIEDVPPDEMQKRGEEFAARDAER
jgi:PhnB protein